jgi:hypothetical protein
MNERGPPAGLGPTSLKAEAERVWQATLDGRTLLQHQRFCLALSAKRSAYRAEGNPPQLSAAPSVDPQLGEDRNCTVSVAVLID